MTIRSFETLNIPGMNTSNHDASSGYIPTGIIHTPYHIVVVIIPLTHKAARRKILSLKIELLSNKLIDDCRAMIDSHRKSIYILQTHLLRAKER